MLDVRRSRTSSSVFTGLSLSSFRKFVTSLFVPVAADLLSIAAMALVILFHIYESSLSWFFGLVVESQWGFGDFWQWVMRLEGSSFGRICVVADCALRTGSAAHAYLGGLAFCF